MIVKTRNPIRTVNVNVKPNGSFSYADGNYHFLDYSFDATESGAESSEFLSSAEGVNLTPIGDNLYLSAEGNLYKYVEGGYYDNNEEYFSAEGENFYNAKGEKVKKAFKSVGKGIGKGFKGIGKGFVKVGKFIGKVAKKVGRSIVKASKTVAKGVKNTGGKIKKGAKKLVHHKKKDKGGKTSDTKGRKASGEQKGRDDEQSRPPSGDAKRDDVFTKELPPATPNTPPQNVVEVEGQKFDATDIPKGKEIVETVDENGKKIAGVEFSAEEVVAVQGADGNIEYHTPENVSKMSIGIKIAIGVGAAAILGVIIYLAVRQKE
jgi:hypothetical protein